MSTTRETRIPVDRWRNLGIIAHVDAGKTTLTERLLYKTGTIHRTGEVHDGAATTDHMELERERGITIGAAAVRANWTPDGGQPHRLTLIDTPGHIDFAIEVERSLRVLDGAVTVFSGVAGVQPQSETVWHQARRHGVPLMAFVNKMDRPGADFDAVVAQMRDTLGANPWVVARPVIEGEHMTGLVDLVAERTWRFDDAGTPSVHAWNDAERGEYADARAELIAAVADSDEPLAELWLTEQPIDATALTAALRRGTLAGKGSPVLPGSAFRNVAIEPLLDAFVAYLPSPLDRPAVIGHADDDGSEVTVAPDADAPLAALVFKVVNQAHGPLAFLRIYAGRLSVGDGVWRSGTDRVQRIGRLAVVRAEDTEAVEHAEAGDIVAIAGWKDVATGETLSAPQHRVRLETIQAQPAVLSWRLSPERSADLLKLGNGLARLAQEDPSFRVGTDPETGETLVWGMGELHLEVMVERLRREWGVQVRTGSPRVAYQETPASASGPVEGKLAKQTGGSGQFARVVLSVAPTGGESNSYEDRSTGGVIPKPFQAAVEKGVASALLEGPRGFPVVGAAVTVLDGQAHAVDSNEAAFHRAAQMAVKSALEATGTVLLEPVMRVSVSAPGSAVGDVLGDLQRRGGQIVNLVDRQERTEIEADVPLAQLDGYSTALRSLSQGRASATVAFHAYRPATLQEAARRTA
ncbi:elongation factor G [Luteibacter sp. UNCMF366Tsu5.1]|uniref:elongation factor G n=1 Tax=Luteibacter sp. UNCMF366Tsu5.1 TaxID=1502758 RepID=UPI00090867F2|nr:elongation factor G [Luteibacter sp. UNCMF366Tsu5.1]SFW43921.1 elongation factor G [Luteibacter sp. UNCMF366Tsu5.1]